MELLRDRFRIYERVSRPDLGEHTLHQKVASFGTFGRIVIGSANLDAQSMVHNGEAVAVIQDEQLRDAFDEMVTTDMGADCARRVSRAQLDSASVGRRIQLFTAGELAWYWL